MPVLQMAFVSAMLMSLLLIVLSQPGLYSANSATGWVQRANVGVFFEPLAIQPLGNQNWHHIFQYVFPETPKFSPTPQCMGSYACFLLHRLDTLNHHIRWTAAQQMNESRSRLYELFPNSASISPSFNPSQRVSRSTVPLIPVIGTVGRYLFGWATYDQIDQLQSQILGVAKDIDKFGENYVQNQDVLSSFMSNMDSRIQNLASLISDSAHWIDLMQEEYQNLFNLTTIASYETASALTRLFDATMLLADVCAHARGIESLMQTQLSPDILPPY
jgi:hypothetical protein